MSKKIDGSELGVAGMSLFRVAPLALEQRFMFDAAGVATGLDAAQDAEAEKMARIAGETLSGEIADQDGSRQEAMAEEGRGAVVVFVDRSVTGHGNLVAGIDPSARVIYLHQNESGLAQMAMALEGLKDVSAIHVISHGGVGHLRVGGDLLTRDNLADYGEALKIIRDSLAEDGDILLYGCEAGSGESGRAFIEALAQSLRADIAASDDPTGAAEEGGDWDLEVAHGVIEADIVISDEARETFAGLLSGVPTVTSKLDGDSLEVILDFANDFDIPKGAALRLNVGGTIVEASLVGDGGSSDSFTFAVSLPSGLYDVDGKIELVSIVLADGTQSGENGLIGKTISQKIDTVVRTADAPDLVEVARPGSASQPGLFMRDRGLASEDTNSTILGTLSNVREGSLSSRAIVSALRSRSLLSDVIDRIFWPGDSQALATEGEELSPRTAPAQESTEPAAAPEAQEGPESDHRSLSPLPEDPQPQPEIPAALEGMIPQDQSAPALDREPATPADDERIGFLEPSGFRDRLKLADRSGESRINDLAHALRSYEEPEKV